VSRVRTLSLFLVRDLYRSPAGAIPPLLALAFYWLTFTLFGVDADYLVAVGGFTMTLVALATTFVLAHRVNRAATYPFLLRLPRRADLLASVGGASLISTVMLAAIFVIAAMLRHDIRLTPLELFYLASRWLALFAFAAAVGLHLSQLVSRRNSHLLAFFLLGAFPTVTDNQRHLLRYGLDWLVRVFNILVYPVTTTMTGVLHLPLVTYLSALLLTLLYTAILALLAAWLFRRKDLLWIE
jgi:ABC-type antimicrobial peptide transport system permease subunit